MPYRLHLPEQEDTRELMVQDEGLTIGEFILHFGDTDLNRTIGIEHVPEDIDPTIQLLNGELTYNHEARTLRHFNWDEERQSVLTRNQSLIFRALVSPPNVVLPRETLLGLFSTNSTTRLHTVDVHVSQIRKALFENFNALSTVRGVGYIFEDHS